MGAFGGVPVSTDVASAIADIPYDAKSVLPLAIGSLAVRVLTWDPFNDEQFAFASDGRVVYVGAWALDDADFVAMLPADAGPVQLEDKWRALVPSDLRTIVEARFGPLGVDPAPRALSPLLVAEPGCRACEGEPFALRIELKIVADQFCKEHGEEAQSLLASASDNTSAWAHWEVVFAGWHLAHVPDPVRRAFLPFWFGGNAPPMDGDGLIEHAHQVLALIEQLETPADLGDALDDLDVDDDDFDDWAETVGYRLGLHREFALAVRVVDALNRCSPEHSANRHAELAVQFARDGRVGDAGRRIGLATDAPGLNALTVILTGEVSEAVGDVEGARRSYENAIPAARLDEDLRLDFELDAWEHLEALALKHGSEEEIVAARENVARVRAELHRPAHPYIAPATRADVETFGHRVGRNDPCPCGSERKYKYCHGRH